MSASLLSFRWRRVASLSGVLVVLGAVAVSAAFAAPFTYKPHGQLIGNSGSGVKSTKDYVPNMRFPIENAPAYANSQVYMAGGSKGGGGGQCAAGNYAYPWWDNFCEKRTWSMPFCPSGKGHQGQDIRPGSCKFNTHWAVAVEDGTITSIGTYSVYEKSVTGVTHRYMHMKMSALKVKVGQKVKMGQRLGLVDNDFGGTSTTLHLHYDRKKYISGVGTVYVPTYASLVNSYKKLLGGGCDVTACAKKSGCGAWSACGGFTSTCDTTGTRKRACVTYACSGGACGSSSKTETQGCAVNTDGKQVAAWSKWSACASAGCATTGSKTRTRQVCQGGKSTIQKETGGCAVTTDGKVLGAWSAWGTCVGATTCGETGSRSRTRSVCKAGKASTVKEQGPCPLSTAGKVLSAWGPWSPCGEFEGLCDATGVRRRSRTICAGGKESVDIAEVACTVNREGQPLEPWSSWSGCAPAVSPCAPTGAKVRTRAVCKGGVPTKTMESQPCVPTCANGGVESDAAGGLEGNDSLGEDPDGALSGTQTLVSSAPSSGCSAQRRGGPLSGMLWLFATLVGVIFLAQRRSNAIIAEVSTLHRAEQGEAVAVDHGGQA